MVSCCCGRTLCSWELLIEKNCCWFIGGYSGDIALSDAEAEDMVERYGDVAKRPIQEWIEHSEIYDSNHQFDTKERPSTEPESKLKKTAENDRKKG